MAAFDSDAFDTDAFSTDAFDFGDLGGGGAVSTTPDATRAMSEFVRTPVTYVVNVVRGIVRNYIS